MSEDRAMAREMKTRYDGVWVRHRARCPALLDRRCTCKPSYIARVYDRDSRRKVASPSYPTADAARSWRTDKLQTIRDGGAVRSSTHRLKDVVDEFETAARAGRALNKKRAPYKPDALRDLESAFRAWIVPELGSKRLDGVRRGDVQRLVDYMVDEGISGSRIRTVVHALRSLYTYAIDRDICHASPVASSIRMPAMGETPRDRTATPAEVKVLLDALPLRDRVPFALAAYAGGRRKEIRHLRWEHFDLDAGLLGWGRDPRARKSARADRHAPIVRPLERILRMWWEEQGRPAAGLVCPGHKPGGRNSGLLSFEALQRRADAVWEPKDREGRPILERKVGDRITAHDLRHVVTTWLDQAGVRPVVKAAILGHEAEGGITQTRYTHVPLADIHEAGRLLARFVAPRHLRRVV